MSERNVAIYARVSTEHEAQLSALENQVQYYDNLLSMHPEWKLYNQYIDEGITGTSVRKRKQFLKMMEDAKEGLFDLIITREVSRFARNTVDTLQETRKLKKLGVEVYFTEDNIWTMNDEDGELRLTIMATLAQNESKKTSMRVKAGQMVSFQNAVPYGNGNILGYERVGKEYVINPEQAETVRIIFDRYLEGWGLRKIQFELEKLGRKTATGLTKWSCSAVGRTLNNPFYCGTIVYRKQYVPDYLEQKKINNFDAVEKVVVEGNHPPIVSKEEYAKVREMMDEKTESKANRGKRGIKPPTDIWGQKLKCICGHSFNRKIWHRNKAGIPQYAYQCYSSIRTGTVETRKRKGLSVEGICAVPMIPAWKLGMMANLVFKRFWQDKKRVLKIANELLDKNIQYELEESNSEEIQQLEGQLKRIKRKQDNLVDMRLSEEIDKEYFLVKKEELEKQVNDIYNKLSALKSIKKLSSDDLQDKLEVLKYALEHNFDFDTYNIPDAIIDAFVERIIVHEEYYEWHLKFLDEGINCLAMGTAKSPDISIVDKSSFSGELQHRLLSHKNRRKFY